MKLEFKPVGFDGRTIKYYPETWAIVSSPEAIVLMREMSESEHPAVEAFHYLPTFVRLNEIVKRESSEEHYANFHSTVGRMCRCVMEFLGYEKVKDVAFTSKFSLFQNGAVYRWIGSDD